MLIHHYAHPTTPAGAGSDTVISNAVQVDPGHRFTAAAAVGDASVVAINVDDDAAAYDFKGLWRWYLIDDALSSGDHYAWNGYVGVQEIGRGDEGQTLIPVGTGRRWNLELNELSALAGFRVISGADGKRPAETISARLAWLIGTLYLPVTDNGLIVYDTTDLDANDYSGQYANAVLSDMAVKIGFNWWIYYDQSAGAGDEVSLAFFHPDSALYSSSIKISNVAADIDGSTVFAASEDAKLKRDPQKIAAGVYLPYTGGAVYEYDYATSYEFAFRDQVAPTASIKTATKATSLADRFLADNAEQDERATIQIHLPAAQLNDIKHGQRIQVKMQNWPGWTSYRWCRVVRKTFAPPANRSQVLYDVPLELSPQGPGQPSGAYALGQISVAFSGIPTLRNPTTPGNVLFALIAAQGNTTKFPISPRFLDNPSLVTPPVPPYSVLQSAAWTVLATATTDYSGQNIGGPCAMGYGGPFHGAAGTCTNGLLVAAAWRYVQPAEVTVNPVAVSTEVSSGSTAVWLWELPATAVPTGVSVEHDVSAGTPQPFGSILPSIVGNAVAIEFWAMSAGHSPIAQPFTSVVVNGTEIQSVLNYTNDPALGSSNVSGWVQIYRLPLGGAGSSQVTVNGAFGHPVVGSPYTALNHCGIAVVLPSGVVLPPILYPSNQTSS